MSTINFTKREITGLLCSINVIIKRMGDMESYSVLDFLTLMNLTLMNLTLMNLTLMKLTRYLTS